MSKKQMIIDVDAGVDDIQAIMMVLNDSDWEVLAITCVSGNTCLDNVWRNVLRVLKICNRLDIPVYKGCCCSLLGTHHPAPLVHGEDGLGEYSSSVPIDDVENLIHSEHACFALSQLVDKYPGQITLVALAPLTNIAMTHRLNPSFHSKLKSLYIMGGNIKAHGNVTPCAEFNFNYDPEAAHIVLNEFTCPTQLFSWETTKKFKVDWEWSNKWLEMNSDKAKFMKGCTELIRKRSRYILNRKGYFSCDLLTMAAVINPKLVLKEKECYVTVELQGKFTRGQAVCDWRNFLKNPRKIKIPVEINLDEYKTMLKNIFL